MSIKMYSKHQIDTRTSVNKGLNSEFIGSLHPFVNLNVSSVYYNYGNSGEQLFTFPVLNSGLEKYRSGRGKENFVQRKGIKGSNDKPLM